MGGHGCATVSDKDLVRSFNILFKCRSKESVTLKPFLRSLLLLRYEKIIDKKMITYS
jgi:hypothetical protein